MLFNIWKQFFWRGNLSRLRGKQSISVSGLLVQSPLAALQVDAKMDELAVLPKRRLHFRSQSIDGGEEPQLPL